MSATSSLTIRVLRRFIAAEGKAKRMVIMIGPPAAGKGFFLGEPESEDGKTKKYKTDKGEERDTSYGYKLPKMLVNEDGKPLISDDDIPDKADYDESDNHLRAIQRDAAQGHFAALKAAKEKGPKEFKRALEDHWYDTKDGKKVGLGDLVKSADDMPDSFDDFFKKTNKDFYVSMRGWHDDASHKNPETGKTKERFKDQARHEFDDAVLAGTEGGAKSGLMIVDSAGEDIDAQDFKGQIEHAKANGYEVSVVFLHPEKEDTELSNLSRNRVYGKRMVDGADIDNWYKNNEAALKAIQDAAPDNFIHYRKGPPDKDPAKAKELRAKARDLMEKLKDMPADERKSATKEVGKILYDLSGYKMQPDTSYGRMSGIKNKKPSKNIAKAVKEMNAEAASRAGAKDDEKGEDDGKSDSKEKSKSRGQFLEEMGDKPVANPNPHGHKKQIKLRSLPWEGQKRYYEQWAEKNAMTRRVVARWKDSTMITAAENKGEGEAKGEKKGWLATWMDDLAGELGKLEVEGYKVEAKALKGPIVLLTVKGAEGDTTTGRKLKDKIEKVMSESTKKNNGDWKEFRNSIRMSNKGEDLVIRCEVIFPK